MAEHHPIETFPRDGSPFLVFVRNAPGSPFGFWTQGHDEHSYPGQLPFPILDHYGIDRSRRKFSHGDMICWALPPEPPEGYTT